MTNQNLKEVFASLSTPLIADACIRLGIPLRIAPFNIRPLICDSRLSGQVLPVRHYGSVDIFLEAMGVAQPGDVLVIDNDARLDEGCVGDLTVLEVQSCQMAGIIVRGCYRDTSELVQIGFPIFGFGAYPAGPRRLDYRHPAALESASFGDFEVSRNDIVFADDDGVIFVPLQNVEAVISIAQTIWQTERRQAEQIRSGNTLRDQLLFQKYLQKRAANPEYTFRKHLRQLGGAIEE